METFWSCRGTSLLRREQPLGTRAGIRLPAKAEESPPIHERPLARVPETGGNHSETARPRGKMMAGPREGSKRLMFRAESVKR